MGLDIKKDDVDNWQYKSLLPKGPLKTEAELKSLHSDFLGYWPGRVKEKFNKSVWFPIDTDYERELFEMSGYIPNERDEMKEQKDLKFHTGVLESPKIKRRLSGATSFILLLISLIALMTVLFLEPPFFCFGFVC